MLARSVIVAALILTIATIAAAQVFNAASYSRPDCTDIPNRITSYSTNVCIRRRGDYKMYDCTAKVIKEDCNSNCSVCATTTPMTLDTCTDNNDPDNEFSAIRYTCGGLIAGYTGTIKDYWTNDDCTGTVLYRIFNNNELTCDSDFNNNGNVTSSSLQCSGTTITSKFCRGDSRCNTECVDTSIMSGCTYPCLRFILSLRCCRSAPLTLFLVCFPACDNGLKWICGPSSASAIILSPLLIVGAILAIAFL
jgi:hypothetical protein